MRHDWEAFSRCSSRKVAPVQGLAALFYSMTTTSCHRIWGAMYSGCPISTGTRRKSAQTTSGCTCLYLDIESRSVDVMTNFAALAEFDLVIDATGEEALSVALDHFAVSHRPDFPPTLHTWIVGNGGAAQALLCDGPDHACTELAARREASGSLP